MNSTNSTKAASAGISRGSKRSIDSCSELQAAPFDPGFKLEATTATKVRGLRQLLDLVPYDADLIDANGQKGVRLVPQSDGSVLIGLVPQFYYDAGIGTGSDGIDTDSIGDQDSSDPTAGEATLVSAGNTLGGDNDYHRRNLWQQTFMIRIQQDEGDERRAIKAADAALAAYDAKFGG